MSSPSALFQPQHVAIAHPTDGEGFRRVVRALLAADVDPDQVVWHVLSEDARSLFQPQSAREAQLPTALATATPVRVPREFDALWRLAFLHSHPGRHALIHRLLWRLQREPELRRQPLDPDMAQLHLLAQAVRREMHRMKAFVRFRPCPHLPRVLQGVPQAGEGGAAATSGSGQSTALTLAEGGLQAPDWWVAWYEPQYPVAESLAGHFIGRMANERWALLTPQVSLCWQNGQLHLAPGAQAIDAPPPDAAETLWLTYYANIFNPARLKPQAMQHAMPRRYWGQLPESRLIRGLVDGAHERTQRMHSSADPAPPAGEALSDWQDPS